MPRQRLGRGVNVNVKVVAWAAGVSVADALTKWWMRRHVTATGRHVLGPLWWRVTYNSGISFSLNAASPIVTTLLTLAIVVGLASVALRAASGLATVGFGLLLGGGVANTIDRLSHVPHRVTDFIAVGSFPVFNVADAAVTLWFLTLVVTLLRGRPVVRR